MIRLGLELDEPLERTLSCMNPTPDGRHCGRCSKCRERRDAFAEAGVSTLMLQPLDGTREGRLRTVETMRRLAG